jgi:hypothetical protein
MRDLLTVFTGTVESARDLAAYLEANDLRSLVVDRQGPVSSPNGGRSIISDVRVATNDVEAANQVVRSWNSQNRHDTQALANRLVKVISASFVIPILWLLVYFVAPDSMPERSITWLCVAWAVMFVVIAQIENRRHTGERITMPHQ